MENHLNPIIRISNYFEETVSQIDLNRENAFVNSTDNSDILNSLR